MFFPYDKGTKVAMAAGITRQMLSVGDRAMVVEITLAKGAEVPPHSHPHEQVGYVARGKLRFKIGDEEHVLAAGAGYFAPSDVVHSCFAEEDTVAIDVFSPVREEYRA